MFINLHDILHCRQNNQYHKLLNDLCDKIVDATNSKYKKKICKKDIIKFVHADIKEFQDQLKEPSETEWGMRTYNLNTRIHHLKDIGDICLNYMTQYSWPSEHKDYLCVLGTRYVLDDVTIEIGTVRYNKYEFSDLEISVSVCNEVIQDDMF